MVVDGDIYSKDGKILYDVPKGKKNYKVKKSVKEIGVYAFYGNGNIRHIRVPSSVKKIAAYAFGNMENLKSVKLSKNLKIAEDHLLARSTKLKTIIYPKKNPHYSGKFWTKVWMQAEKNVYKGRETKKDQGEWFAENLYHLCKKSAGKKTGKRRRIQWKDYRGFIIPSMRNEGCRTYAAALRFAYHLYFMSYTSKIRSP